MQSERSRLGGPEGNRLCRRLPDRFRCRRPVIRPVVGCEVCKCVRTWMERESGAERMCVTACVCEWVDGGRSVSGHLALGKRERLVVAAVVVVVVVVTVVPVMA